MTSSERSAVDAAQEQAPGAPGAKASDIEVWQALCTALHGALKADREMAAGPEGAAADAACERFDGWVDQAMGAYSELVVRGVTGLVEDVLVERGRPGDPAAGGGVS